MLQTIRRTVLAEAAIDYVVAGMHMTAARVVELRMGQWLAHPET